MSLQAKRSRMLLSAPTFDLTDNIRRTRNNSFRCSHCEVTFLQRHRLEEHIIERHSGPQSKPFKCALCGRKFLEKIGIESHIVNFHKKKSHSCTFCEKGFWSYDKFQKHVKSHQTPFKCPACPKTFQYKSALDQHITHCRADNLICRKCLMAFRDASQLLEHMRQRHTEAPAESSRKKKFPLNCPHCKAGFERQEDLKEHIEKSHKEFSGSTSNSSYMNSFQSFLSERICRTLEPVPEESQRKVQKKK